MCGGRPRAAGADQCLGRSLRAYSAAVSSVVSLLVTDIVDSTRLWVRYEREMSADL
jgi:class 3 adenylate cyclase